MKALDFLEVADLINKSRTTEIDTNPIRLEKGKWALYKGMNKVPNFSYPFNILYLYADFTKDAIFPALNAITYPIATQIVYAPSIKESIIEACKQSLKRKKMILAGVLDLKIFLKSFVQEQLRSYTDKLKNLKPAFFVDPHYDTPSQIKRKFPNPLSLFFTDESEDVIDGALAILLAEPGQGKTFTAQYLANVLSEKDYIPIYIHSSQWTTMQEEDLSSLYKTITHSFRYYNSSIDWIEGEEEMFVKVTLKVGLFRIIFDGFDEYILWNNGKISGDEVIKTLHELTQNSSARVLVTSRTTFWNSSITLENSLSNIYKYSIQPFDINHAKDYFFKRFKDSPKSVEKAVSVFTQLRSSGNSEFKNSFAGRGIILSLVADLCSFDTDVSTYDGNISVWQWIISALCQREEQRQQLQINAANQLQVLRFFAEEKSKGHQPTSILLSDIISLVCDDLSKDEINLLLGDIKNRGKLTDHPLITKDQSTGLWSFKHEQIEFNLIAEQIINFAKQSNPVALHKFFLELEVKGSLLDDLTIVIIEQLNISSEMNTQATFTQLLTNLKKWDLKTNQKPRTLYNTSIFLGKLIISFLNKKIPIGGDKEIRSNELFSLIGEKHISGFHFTGTLSSFDFSNIDFLYCTFDNLIWSNCRFNSKTKFTNCYFIGGEIHNCTDFGNAIFSKDVEFDKFAEMSVNYERIKHGNRKVDSNDIKRDIILFVRKFIPREGVFKNVYDDGLLKGQLFVSPYKNELLSVMKKYIIDENLDDSGHYYKIRNESKNSINHFLNNGIFNEELAKAYNELLRKLKIDQ